MGMVAALCGLVLPKYWDASGCWRGSGVCVLRGGRAERDWEMVGVKPCTAGMRRGGFGLAKQTDVRGAAASSLCAVARSGGGGGGARFPPCWDLDCGTSALVSRMSRARAEARVLAARPPPPLASATAARAPLRAPCPAAPHHGGHQAGGGNAASGVLTACACLVAGPSCLLLWTHVQYNPALAADYPSFCLFSGSLW